MKARILVGAGLLACLFWSSLLGTEARAQVPYRRYSSPSGPTLTPYLNYFRFDNGAIGDPYNAWIRPRQQLDRELYELNQNDRANRQFSQKTSEQLREALSAPTGTGASFRNYSHYYSAPAASSAGRRATR